MLFLHFMGFKTHPSKKNYIKAKKKKNLSLTYQIEIGTIRYGPNFYISWGGVPKYKYGLKSRWTTWLPVEEFWTHSCSVPPICSWAPPSPSPVYYVSQLVFLELKTGFYHSLWIQYIQYFVHKFLNFLHTKAKLSWTG